MNILALFKPIRVFVLDVDGVLTDGTLQLLKDGILSRKMHIRDGYALQLAVKTGYRVAVISGGSSGEVARRLEGLGVSDVFMSVEDKRQVLERYLADHDLSPEAVLYMGDDLPDYQAMQIAGLKACPSDACVEIKTIAHYVSPFRGGEGCVRDVIEKVLKLNEGWPATGQ